MDELRISGKSALSMIFAASGSCEAGASAPFLFFAATIKKRGIRRTINVLKSAPTSSLEYAEYEGVGSVWNLHQEPQYFCDGWKARLVEGNPTYKLVET